MYTYYLRLSDTHGIHYLSSDSRLLCLHRLDGPSYDEEYFIFGIQYTVDEYWRIINRWKVLLQRLYYRRLLKSPVAKELIQQYYQVKVENELNGN